MKKSFFLFLYFISLSAYPGDENAYIYGNDGTIEGIKYNYRDNVIKFNIGDMSFDVFSKDNFFLKKCLLDNYSDSIDTGISFLTTDHEAIVFQSSGRFVLTKDVIDICNSSEEKHAEVYPPVNIGMIADMNFRKNVALIYHPMGNISGKMVYQAELSKFVKKNYRSSSFLTEVDPEKIQYLITGRFFYNGSYRDLEKKSYSGPFDLVSGVISPDAKYVDPFGLGCDIDKVNHSIPHVYEISTAQRVAFKSDPALSAIINKEQIDKKCRQLLKASASLKDLGGYLSQ